MEALQEAVPFHFVGKHSAYAVRVTRADFTQWDDKLAGGKPASTPEVRTPNTTHSEYLRLSHPVGRQTSGWEKQHAGGAYP
eukprot:5768781-Pyramimonas_sp.AAC.1